MNWLLVALLFAVPVQEKEEKDKPKQEDKKPETDPEKEGHTHGEDEHKRRTPSAHGESMTLCATWGYCFPAGHDPETWRKHLPEGMTLHACPKIAVCHPEQEDHDKRFCGDAQGKGTRSHCDQSCREQCCFCCGSP